MTPAEVYAMTNSEYAALVQFQVDDYRRQARQARRRGR
jgi:hypothetical protein